MNEDTKKAFVRCSLNWAKRTIASSLDVSDADLYTIVYGQATKLWVSEARFRGIKLDTINDFVPSVDKKSKKRSSLTED